ncbi:uncharacterized protein LOC123652247 [Pipistrellus kuhlii]|uniref:Uncharacterized protein n=1 Tax=Pipistrellus kuhlii TaxID=59472 RepID=A0A7J7VVG2_PIPKU|nr:uncharacterized protein LOC123652247 [Pipistrellus kuhlii]KAF6328961.1 hypothetical protein mPipKuh1_008290 [Pipistrellus kuhlii]
MAARTRPLPKDKVPAALSAFQEQRGAWTGPGKTQGVERAEIERVCQVLRQLGPSDSAKSRLSTPTSDTIGDFPLRLYPNYRLKPMSETSPFPSHRPPGQEDAGPCSPQRGPSPAWPREWCPSKTTNPIRQCALLLRQREIRVNKAGLEWAGPGGLGNGAQWAEDSNRQRSGHRPAEEEVFCRIQALKYSLPIFLGIINNQLSGSNCGLSSRTCR